MSENVAKPLGVKAAAQCRRSVQTVFDGLVSHVPVAPSGVPNERGRVDDVGIIQVDLVEFPLPKAPSDESKTKLYPAGKLARYCQLERSDRGCRWSNCCN